MSRMSYSLMRILFALVVGLVLVIWPHAAVAYIVIAVGIAFLLPGLLSLLGYFLGGKRQEGELRRRFPLEGLGSLLLGLWLMLMPDFFVGALMFLLGFVLVMGGIQQIASLAVARRWTPVPWAFYLVPFLILIAGIVVLFNPLETLDAAFIMIGISCLVYALSELFNWLRFMRHRPQVKEITEE